MPRPIRLIQYGLGPIGQACVRQIVERHPHTLQIVGAVDVDPDKVGQDVAGVCGIADALGVQVSPALANALEGCVADVVLHTTSSFLDVVADQLKECIHAGMNVVSSTEELSYPFHRHPELSRELDDLAVEHGVCVVGTGVNPGFVMDSLALVASAVCARVDGIRIERVVDARLRRLPLQKKIGAGLTPLEFAARKEAGGFGHIGLRESAQMVAAGLGWEIESLEETLEPELTSPSLSGNGNASACTVLGIRQQVILRASDGRTVELALRMFVGAQPAADSIEIDGDPPLRLTIPGGVFGDTATVAMLVNTVPRAIDAGPGLKTMLDLPLPRAFDGVTGSPVLVSRSRERL